MGSKKSSFNMGDEFNGSGKKVYLRATTYKTYKPLSQENVRLTRDFKQCIPKALGAVPLIGTAGEGSAGALSKAVGALAAAVHITVQKGSEAGKYSASFNVSKKRLTNGSYLHESKQKTSKGAESQI